MPAPLLWTGTGEGRWCGGAGAIAGSSMEESGGWMGASIGSGDVGGGSAMDAGASELEASDAVTALMFSDSDTSGSELDGRLAAKMSGLPASSSAETCAIVAASPSSVLGGSGFAGG